MMLGAPGAGKGTISTMLSEKYNIPHISTGDIFREEAKTNKELQEIMNSGKLVPDDVVNEIVKKRLQKEDCQNGYILDGFPRTIAQAEFLDNNNISFDSVVDLEVTEEEVIRRLGSRRVCTKCKAVYNITTHNPKQENVCDNCNETLIQREDDKPESIKHRLKVYLEKTAPLIEYYTKKGILKEVDANPSIQEVFELTLKVLE